MAVSPKLFEQVSDLLTDGAIIIVKGRVEVKLPRQAKEAAEPSGDDDDDDTAVRKKADDMGVEVGSYGDHEVKAPPPEPEPLDDDIIADEFEQDIEPDISDEELDAQIKSLGDLSQDALLDKLDANSPVDINIDDE